MMRKVLLLVEGPTEESFVKRVVGPPLEKSRLALVPIIIKTKFVPGAKPFKGGYVRYAEFSRQVNSLLGDKSAICVTTLLDYYGLPDDFPGRKAPEGVTAQQRVNNVQSAIKRDFDDARFHPFLLLHEFESLLFVVPTEIARATQTQGMQAKLQAIRKLFPRSPEDINDSPNTAPSKRIESVCGRAYQKTAHGALIAARIGLDAIRRECPHFNSWLEMLEKL